MGVTIDLCSPQRGVVADVARRLSAAPTGKRPAASGDSPSKRRCAEVIDLDLDDDDDEDGDCVQVARPKAVASALSAGLSSAGAGTSAGADGDGDELQMTGATGAFSLIDFPHAREWCAVQPFKPGCEGKFCSNCYCYVCDEPASKCPRWAEHAPAVNSDPGWRRLRLQWKAAKASGAQPPPSIVAGGSSSAHRPLAFSQQAPPLTAHRAAPHPPPRPMQPHQLPRPMQQPPRPMQLPPLPRSMVPPPRPLQPPSTSAFPRRGQQLSCAELLSRVQQIYPAEAPEPAGLVNCQLRPYQKQSLAFMLSLENAASNTATTSSASLPPPRFGWLADEMGMGKTAVCISLVLARPSACIRAPELRTSANSQCDVKATLVATTASLIGQWADEFERFAPSLKVLVYHGSPKQHALDIRDCDVVLTTHGTALRCPPSVHFHRVIIDECHVITSRAYAPGVGAGYFCWGCTGTPCTSSLDDLVKQARFLARTRTQCAHGAGHLRPSDGENAHVQRLVDAMANSDRLVEAVRTLMIRHTKKQQIGSGDALALPSSDMQTVWITPSPLELAAFKTMAEFDKPVPLAGAIAAGFGLHGVSFRLRACGYNFGKCCLTMSKTITTMMRVKQAGLQPTQVDVLDESKCSKVLHLTAELLQLRQTEPSMHVVVFTHYLSMQEVVVRALKKQGLDVLCFEGSTPPRQRWDMIRSFQDTAGQAGARAKVFVITLTAGAVGITLTAANRVYLMEPDLDPAVEAQAAGRIHRLGQTKGVLIRRFAFKSTIEERICKLHEHIRAGRVTVPDGRYTARLIEWLRKI